MKRTLSLILAVCMVALLLFAVACSKETTPETKDAAPATTTDPAPAADPAATPAVASADPAPAAEIDLAQTLPCEYVPEKLEAGLEVLVAVSANNLADDFMLGLCNGLAGALEELGFTCDISSSEKDANNQLNLLENYITMGYAAVGVIPMDVNSLQDIMNKGREAGTYICFMGSHPSFDFVGCCAVDQVVAGQETFNIASAWVDQQYPDAAPGSVHVAFGGSLVTADTTTRTNTIKQCIEDDPRMTLSYYVETVSTADEAYTFTEAALLTDPSIRTFIFFTAVNATGCNSYLTSNYAGQLDEFGIILSGLSKAVVELIDIRATGGESAVIGTINTGFDEVWQGMFYCIEGLLLKGEQTPYVVDEPVYAITANDLYVTPAA